MIITQTRNDSELTIALEGRLDTSTSPELETVLAQELPTVTAIVFDLNQLKYISSSGLRVLLKTQKQMNKKGTMVLIGVNETVMEVFEVTGFSDILTIQ